MAVHPRYRRQGLGEALLRHVVASTHGRIDLFVNADNVAARTLYERVRFTLDESTNELSDRHVTLLVR